VAFDVTSFRHLLTGQYSLTIFTLIGAVSITYFRSSVGLLAHIIPRGTLRHPSARTDILFWLARMLTKPLYIFSNTATAVFSGTMMYHALGLLFPLPHPSPASPVTLVLFTVTMLLAFDLSYYIYHYLQHKIPFMWELHKVHHSAEVMVGVTQGRIHPLDDYMQHFWDALIPGLAYGAWSFFALNPVEVTVYGIDVYVLRNVLMMDFVRHTHLKLSFGWLNAVILCPHWHQLHHSTNPQHYDKNFGLMLSIWDRMFGTLVIPKPDETFAFGLANNEHREYQSLTAIYVLPLLKIYRRIRPAQSGQHSEV
jgi:sterol desaturase/sphingolipid hydroxylase (fatty acid hydroxylase superfamily)